MDDPNAEFSYHMGGALYIPQRRAPTPEPVPSSSRTLPEQVTSRSLPESVPSSSSAPCLSPTYTSDPNSSVAVKDGDIVEESDQSSLYKDEDDSSIGSTGSAQDTRDDGEPLSEEPSRSLKRILEEDESSEQETSNAVPRSNKRSKLSNCKNKKWDERLEELKKFKAKHGHCRVPASSRRSLYSWLNNQRNNYLNQTSPNCLKGVSERERRTNALESVLGEGLRDGHGSIWNARLEELKKFKTKHWQSRLPPSCGSLYRWLERQRYRKLNPNSPNFLKNEPKRKRRMKELESVLGVGLWDGQIPWQGHLEELKKFKANFGHCRVPPSCAPLYKWLYHQRNHLNPNSPTSLKNVSVRQRRTKELESVLGEGLWDARIANSKTKGLKSNDA